MASSTPTCRVLGWERAQRARSSAIRSCPKRSRCRTRRGPCVGAKLGVLPCPSSRSSSTAVTWCSRYSGFSRRCAGQRTRFALSRCSLAARPSQRVWRPSTLWPDCSRNVRVPSRVRHSRLVSTTIQHLLPSITPQTRDVSIRLLPPLLPPPSLHCSRSFDAGLIITQFQFIHAFTSASWPYMIDKCSYSVSP